MKDAEFRDDLGSYYAVSHKSLVPVVMLEIVITVKIVLTVASMQHRGIEDN